MTISPDARIPPASVHALSGSSAGPGRPFAPLATVHELPDPFVPLGDAAAGVAAGLAAQRAAAAHRDAEMIALAGRIKRLMERHYAHRELIDRLQDQVSAAHPSTCERTGRSATQDEFKAHQAAVRPMEERLELPRLRKEGRRMIERLVRWTQQLAAMEPATLAGLGEKAAVVLAVREADRFDYFADVVGDAVQHDAVRLAAVDGMPTQAADDPFATYHAEILGLQTVIDTTPEGSERQEAAWKRWGEIDRMAMVSGPTTLAGVVGALKYARRELFQFEIGGLKEGEMGTGEPCVIVLHLLDKAIGTLSRWEASPLPAVTRAA